MTPSHQPTLFSLLSRLSKLVPTVILSTRPQRHFSKYLFSRGLHHSVELGVIYQTVLVTVSLVNNHLNTHLPNQIELNDVLHRASNEAPQRFPIPILCPIAIGGLFCDCEIFAKVRLKL